MEGDYPAVSPKMSASSGLLESPLDMDLGGKAAASARIRNN
jgi:hypothetical protein